MEDTATADNRETLASFLGAAANEGRTVKARLKASDRVIARVTDGIYRQPASAIRELISNAWDADANNVTVLTDAPRFSKIYVRDDGAGMSFETLSRLVHSIGGSAKRQEEGADLGITALDDPERTPKGRPIIGKIGIGLFSVSQISRRFRIITKVSGENYRLIAEVQLRAFSEDPEDRAEDHDDDDKFLAGDVYIVRERADDLASHGTDIILEDIKPGVRDILRDADRWRAIDERQAALNNGDFEAAKQIRITEPALHTGWIAGSLISKDTTILTKMQRLPWDIATPPDQKMAYLMRGIEQQFTRTERPDLGTSLDYYLSMIWSLALSVPVRYVKEHPFDLKASPQVRLFWLSNEMRGGATEISMKPGQSVREAIRANVPSHPELLDGLTSSSDDFRVIVDDIELRRPIKFDPMPTGSRGMQQSLLFVGKYQPNLASISKSQRGGDLGLEGYFFWNGRIVPKENNGVLVRIRGSSGGLFDPTFFKYGVAETTRLKQITSELFVQRGLDAALNIDRESFNFAHPHFQLVSGWVHRALRQVTNRHKDITEKLRQDKRRTEAVSEEARIDDIAERVWEHRQGEELSPEIEIADTRDEAVGLRQRGIVAIERSAVPELEVFDNTSRNIIDAEAKALMKILSAYEITKFTDYDEQHELIAMILRLFRRGASQ